MSEETNDRLRDEATGRFYKAVTDAAMRGDSEPHPLENFKPMPEAPKQEPESFGSDVEGLKSAARELQEHRAAAAPPVPRHYADTADGVTPRPPNETITAERGARDLADIRRAQHDAAETLANIELQKQIDEFRQNEFSRERGIEPTEQVAQEVEQQLAPQPETPQPEAPQTNKIQQALQDPEIRAALEQQVQATEQARQQYAQATQAATQQALAVTMSQFPELANLHPSQWQGALQVLAKENPQRYVAFQSHAAKVQQLHGAWQQAAVQRQQQQAEQTQHYMKQQDLAFDAAIANEPAEVRERVLKAAPDVLTKAYGISREELGQAWQTQPLMRDVRVQRMMYDAVKHHLAAQGIRPVHNVPKVVRPGVAEGRATSDSITLSEKMRQFREAPTAKSGAAALQARRRAAANQR